jgi:hypothetical protein
LVVKNFSGKPCWLSIYNQHGVEIDRVEVLPDLSGPCRLRKHSDDFEWLMVRDGRFSERGFLLIPETKWEVVGLPEPEEGILLLVGEEVAPHVRGRRDVLVLSADGELRFA